MYQCLSVIAPAPSTADAENKGHDRPHDLFRRHQEIANSENHGDGPTHDRSGQQETHRGDGNHYGHHGGLTVALAIHPVGSHQPPPTPSTKVTTIRMT